LTLGKGLVNIRLQNGFDANGFLLPPLTVMMGVGSYNPISGMELAWGYGYRRADPPAGLPSPAERTKVIPYEINYYLGNFAPRGDAGTPYIGLGTHYLYYTYHSLGDKFHSSGYLIPLILGYEFGAGGQYVFGFDFRKPVFTNLRFRSTIAGDGTQMLTPYDIDNGFGDVSISLMFKKRID
jgi:hypothetical protein